MDDGSFEVDGEQNSPEIIISMWDEDELKHFEVRQRDIMEYKT